MSEAPALSFWSVASDDPQRVALIDDAGRETTYEALLRWVHRSSHGFRTRHLDRGDAIAVSSPNVAQHLELHLAAVQSGLYFVPISRHLTLTVPTMFQR